MPSYTHVPARVFSLSSVIVTHTPGLCINIDTVTDNTCAVHEIYRHVTRKLKALSWRHTFAA